MSVLASESTSPRLRTRGAGGVRRIVLLTSSLGYGHVQASDAIAAALNHADPSASIRRLDFWSLMNPAVAASIKHLYLELVQNHSELYDRCHRLDHHTWRLLVETGAELPPELRDLSELIVTNRLSRERFDGWDGPYLSDLILYPTVCAALPRTGQRRINPPALPRVALLASIWLRLQRRMRQQLARLAPDVVVATQMMPAALAAAVKSERGLTLPTISVLTDFGVHDFWIQRSTDLYCVPDSDMAADLAGRLPRARADVSGVPLMPGFAKPPSQEASRTALGLDAAKPVVLVLGGGLGIGVEAVARRLLERMTGLQVLVMTGHNEQARRALEQIAASYTGRLVICGWSGDMVTPMAAASVIVGKPGGLTVAEALASGRPLLATRSLRGQEGFNVDFLERHRVGRLVRDDDVPSQVETLLADQNELRAMQARALELGRRNGAEKIAHRAIEFADRYRHRASEGARV